MTVRDGSVVAAVLLLALHHYLFSFQRFTLLIARKNATPETSVTDLQILISPTILGLLSWLTTLLTVMIAVALGWIFRWWYGVLYLFVDLVVLSFVPLVPFKAHFAKLAQQALASHPAVPSDVRSRLTIDVIRAGAGHSI